MKNTEKKIAKTIQSFIESMNEQEIQYAVMRNYEMLPEIGNDLDIVANYDMIEPIKSVLRDIAKDQNWDVLTEVESFRSENEATDIHVFKLYDLENIACLHIDVFHGANALTSCFYTGKELVGQRVKRDWFYTICPLHERLIRLNQISGIYDGTMSLKLEKYTSIFYPLPQSEQIEFEQEVKKKFGREGYKAYLSIIEGDYDSGTKLWKKAKVFNKLKDSALNPLSAFRSIQTRVFDMSEQFLLNPPGLKIWLDVEDVKGKCNQVLSEAMQILVEQKVFSVTSMQISIGQYDRKKQEIRTLERSGLLLKYGNKRITPDIPQYDMELSEDEVTNSQPLEIAKEFVLNAARKHQVLFAKHDEIQTLTYL